MGKLIGKAHLKKTKAQKTAIKKSGKVGSANRMYAAESHMRTGKVHTGNAPRGYARAHHTALAGAGTALAGIGVAHAGFHSHNAKAVKAGIGMYAGGLATAYGGAVARDKAARKSTGTKRAALYGFNKTGPKKSKSKRVGRGKK